MEPDGRGVKADRTSVDFLEAQTYLGDGAYAGLDRFGSFVLWTSNGIDVRNRIVLEQKVLWNLLVWLRNHVEKTP